MTARLGPWLAVFLLTVLALAVRLNGFDWRDGGLSTDEARVALAAQGVFRTGLPLLPAGPDGVNGPGRLYTRGLVTIYATVPSTVLFSMHDWSARLPSLLMGALQVPSMFLLGRAVGGTWPGLAAAVFVVMAGPLIGWSRQAWPPAAFVLLLTLTTYAMHRGFVRDEPRWQVWTACGFLVTLLAYEMAMILPAGLGLYLLGRLALRDPGWWQKRATLAAALVAGLAVALLAVMGLALRSGTLAGADAEFRHYFTPSLSLSGVGYYWRQVWGGALPLALVALAGLLWQVRGGLASRRTMHAVPTHSAMSGVARPGSVRAPGLLLALLFVALLVPTFIIQTKQEQQYGLAALPFAAALWAWGLGALAGSPAPRWGQQWVALSVAVVSFALVVGPDTVAALRPQTVPRAPTWLADLRIQGFQPRDTNMLILAESPLVTQLYLGRADFYVHPEGFERYAYQDGPVARSIYTPAVLLKQAGDFEQLVNGPYAGRTLWIVGQDDRLPRLTRQMDAALWERLQAASGVSRPTRGWWIMKVTLPV
ncbi:MAG: glycosyltransferase family 39 protein [Chloroflexi bacterium]|nr:glycosyltransferase family 39 protein [Chloroflexota bacterium]